MRRLLRNGRVLASLLVVGAILAVALWPETVAVDFAPVTQGPLTVTIDEEGETRVRERFVISAPVTGYLRRIELEPGDPVARGAVLASLTPLEPALLDVRSRGELAAAAEAARAALGQARAERQRSAAAFERAKALLARQEALVASGLVSRDELEATETGVRTAEEAARAAEFGVSRAEYELQTAQARLARPSPGGRGIEIQSPIDGVVLKRHRESAAVVPAGEPLLDIGSPVRLEVVSDLLSRDAVRVSPGNRVLLEQWGGSEELEGRVRLVEPSGFTKISALGVEEQRVNVLMDFVDVERAARVLGDAYRVEVRIVVWEEAAVIKMPVGSLFRRGDQWAVFAQADGRARLRPVVIGQRNGTEAQVLDGVTDGDTVVVHPPDTLRDGMRVTARPS